MTQAIVTATHSLNLRRLQFNLRGLMFLTFVIALGAAAARVSVGLAIVAIPLLTVALARTVFALSQGAATGQTPDATARMMATFGRSLFLVVAMIVVSLFTLLMGGVFTVLVTLRLIGRIAGIAYIVLRACVLKWWRFTRRASNTAEATVTRLKLRDLFAWLRRHCRAALIALSERDVRLLRRFLSCGDVTRNRQPHTGRPANHSNGRSPRASSTA